MTTLLEVHLEISHCILRLRVLEDRQWRCFTSADTSILRMCGIFFFVGGVISFIRVDSIWCMAFHRSLTIGDVHKLFFSWLTSRWPWSFKHINIMNESKLDIWFYRSHFLLVRCDYICFIHSFIHFSCFYCIYLHKVFFSFVLFFLLLLGIFSFNSLSFFHHYFLLFSFLFIFFFISFFVLC